MSQNRTHVTSARRELAERKDEAALCMAELKAAQELVATGGSGARTLTVTIKDIFGAISVDRVAVRSETTTPEEKVVVQDIPCNISLPAGVAAFDLVFMAEHAAAISTDAVQAGTATAGNEDDAKKPPAIHSASAGGAGTGVTDATDNDEVVVSAADAAEAAEAEAESAVNASSEETKGNANADTSELGNGEGANASPSAVAENGAPAATEESAPATRPSPEESEKLMAGAANGDAADTQASAVDLPATNGDTAAPAVPLVEPAMAAALGCSTTTTEVVVPSSELDFKSTQGQWRYLEADSRPVEGDDAVEVTKGIKFTTSMEGQDAAEDESRILELTKKYEEAEKRVRSAETVLKRLQPQSGGTGAGARKKSAAGTGGRKSALKKGGVRAIKSEGGKGKGVVGTASAAFGLLYGKARSAGTFIWGGRNLVFFVSAVALIHLRGDYLAV